MSKNLALVVNIEFQDSISTDEDIREIAANVALAIKREACNMGISPEESDTFARSVSISYQGVEIVTDSFV